MRYDLNKLFNREYALSLWGKNEHDLNGEEFCLKCGLNKYLFSTGKCFSDHLHIALDIALEDWAKEGAVAQQEKKFINYLKLNPKFKEEDII